jgi:hypothetical protein
MKIREKILLWVFVITMLVIFLEITKVLEGIKIK